MISSFFHTFFYNPIYNVLVFLVSVVPGGDVGVAVILLTIFIRLVLLPFSLSAARTQRAMKQLEPKLKALKEKHKGDKEKEATETLALYRDAKVNPFASILTVFIQIPVLLAVYWVFRFEPFTTLDTARLYTFTPVPHAVSLLFLGLISVTNKSLLLAIIAGAMQFVQAHFALSGTLKPGSESQGDFQKAMAMQLRFVFPALIGVISYTTSGAVALYFITTNIAGALQEWWVKKQLAKTAAAV
jgi:YidC/Oxa1 family membrane protein insertase